jgi:hypothetical protein
MFFRQATTARSIRAAVFGSGMIWMAQQARIVGFGVVIGNTIIYRLRIVYNINLAMLQQISVFVSLVLHQRWWVLR